MGFQLLSKLGGGAAPNFLSRLPLVESGNSTVAETPCVFSKGRVAVPDPRLVFDVCFKVTAKWMCNAQKTNYTWYQHRKRCSASR